MQDLPAKEDVLSICLSIWLPQTRPSGGFALVASFELASSGQNYRIKLTSLNDRDARELLLSRMVGNEVAMRETRDL